MACVLAAGPPTLSHILKDLASAKGNLAKLDIVATLEEFDLAKLVGLRYMNMTNHQGAKMSLFTSHVKAPKIIPEDLKAFIASRNKLDLELYDYGVKVMMERVDQLVECVEEEHEQGLRDAREHMKRLV
eukprot:m.62693 g.62693  ORF g.62693 m.62693 type:complete len:129 (+) comp13933_c1_seq45:751-1137(+)